MSILKLMKWDLVYLLNTFRNTALQTFAAEKASVYSNIRNHQNTKRVCFSMRRESWTIEQMAESLGEILPLRTHFTFITLN